MYIFNNNNNKKKYNADKGTFSYVGDMETEQKHEPPRTAAQKAIAFERLVFQKVAKTIIFKRLVFYSKEVRKKEPKKERSTRHPGWALASLV